MRKVRNIAVCLLVLAAAALWAKWAAQEKAARDLEACRRNLKNLGTALEMYSTDHSGRYRGTTGGYGPTELTMRAGLVPNYVRPFPTCPAAGEDTYSRTYTIETCPDSYLFWCSGNHHGDVYPGYNSVQGLTETLDDIQYIWWGSSAKPCPPGESPYLGERR